MNVEVNEVKISVTVPKENVEEIRNSVCNMGAGLIGNYTFCSIMTKVIGTFKPNFDADPYIGENNKLEEVEEVKLEVICPIKKAKKIVGKIEKIHPYEEPVIEVIPLISRKSLG